MTDIATGFAGRVRGAGDEPRRWHRVQVAVPASAAANGAVAALSRSSTHTEAWWIGDDGSVYGARWTETTGWQPPYRLPDTSGASKQSGLTAVSRGSTHMEVWWIGNDGAIHGVRWTKATGWQSAYKVPDTGGAFKQGGITAVSRGSTHMEVWWIGDDGAIHSVPWTEATGWQAPKAVPNSGGASKQGGITALSRSSTHMEIWWIGDDGSVKGAAWTQAAGWNGPYQIAPSGASKQAGIAAVSRFATHMEVWWIGDDGSVKGAAWTQAAGWNGPYQIAPSGASKQAGIAAVSRFATHMEVWWIADDGSVQGAWWTEEAGWQTPYRLPNVLGAAKQGGITALSRFSTHMELWWVGDDRSVQDSWWQDEPAPSPPGRPLRSFTGTLPYASEIFGVYKPLAGWFGSRNVERLAPHLLREAHGVHGAPGVADAYQKVTDDVLARIRFLAANEEGVLSPVGLVNLFRQYFFEFDSFLGAPAGHLWISPGGTVEVVESSTRKTLIEKTAEVLEESIRKSEESLTTQEDLADAVKEDNSNDIKLGASASAGANFAGIYHADASMSFSTESTTKSSSEETHKHTRNQSSKVTSEIRRNFKTTFKTVTETTDTTSRRYVVQNTTDQLVNYELRRKMRKVGVQVQHLGARLSWQAFVDDPGKTLGLGELIHVVPAPDLTSIPKPVPPPPLTAITTKFTAYFPIFKARGTEDPPEAGWEYVHVHPGFRTIATHDKAKWIDAVFTFTPPPPDTGGRPDQQYKLRDVKFVGTGPGRSWVPRVIESNPQWNNFDAYAAAINVGDLSPIPLNFEVTWTPPESTPAWDLYHLEKAEYDKQVDELERIAFAAAVRDRSKLVRDIPQRRSEDLRAEERHIVYGSLIRDLSLITDDHLNSEIVRQIFDVDEMLYFVAPDYWRPGNVPPFPRPPHPPLTDGVTGRYPVPAPPTPDEIKADALAGTTVTSSYSHTAKNNHLELGSDGKPVRSDEWRVNYPIAHDSAPAPLGSSLGWLIQIDADARRNQFLNAAWVKAVLPIRPGHERDALKWLQDANVEGQAGLDRDYIFQPGDPPEWEKDPATGKARKYRWVLDRLAESLESDNTDLRNTLATETVFETGFDPLEGGFRPAEPYQIFDQWIEVLPTDQIAAVEVTYDPRTGQQP
ncbi:hypothetical protein [Nocardia gipuzkoensis]|uniref:hypothetical protein n=1 Tax=Nocardia gipuzkoensis TaxID=2749991 RepID=UPI003EE31B3F